MQPADAVLKFLRSVGRPSEADFYLQLFRSAAPESFAMIVVEGTVADQARDAVARDLRFLSALGLTPVVALGLYDGAAAERNAEPLAAELRATGAHAQAFEADASPQHIVDTTRQRALPVLPLQGATEVERLERLSELVNALQTRKLIFLHSSGGLTQNGERVSIVDLGHDLDTLRQSPELAPLQRKLLEHAHTLIFERVRHRLLIAVASPLDLLHELFTIKGAGTILRKGAAVRKYERPDDVDRTRLTQLLRSSFQRTPSDEFLMRGFSRAYIAEDYRGAALVRDTPLGTYLTKFAVTSEAQGEGIGHDLWRRLRQSHPRILWRARPGNPISSWYEQQCDARIRTPHWTAYTLGTEVPDLPAIVDYVLAQPDDFT